MSAWARWGRGVGVLGAAAARLLGVLVALAVLLLGAVWALAHNDAVTERALGWLPGITVVEPRGALLGDFAARRLEVALPRGGRLTLVEPVWQGLSVVVDPQVRWRLGVRADTLSARRLQLDWVSGPPGPASPPPTSFAVPVSLEVKTLRLQEAHSSLWGATTPFTALDATVRVQRAPEQSTDAPVAVHAVMLRSLAWMGWNASGRAQIGTDRPLAVVATANLKRAEGGGTWSVRGPLQDLRVQGELVWRGEGPTPPALTVQARLQPFAAWPLPELAARTRDVDLSALWPGGPLSRLQGDIALRPTDAKGLEADVDLRNSEAGAWDVGRVPVQALRGRIALDEARQKGGLQAMLASGAVTLTAQLPGVPRQAGTAGQLALTGGWRLQEAPTAARAAPPPRLTLALQGVHLPALDGRAPPLRLQGDVQLAPGLVQGGRLTDVRAWQGELAARLGGEARPAPGTAARWPAQPVSLMLDGRVTAESLSVSRLVLQAPQGQEAVMSDTLVRWSAAAAPRPWAAKGALTVRAFDPRLWLPWPAAAQGTNRLSGEARFDVDGLGGGQADLALQPSQLAGLPVQGDVRWRGGTAQRRATLALKADAAGNSVALQGDWPVKPGQDAAAWWTASLPDQRWQGQLQGPALAALQPMLPLVGLSRLGGTAQGRIQWAGNWPRFSTEGELSAAQLTWQTPQGQPALLNTATARWQLDTRQADAVLDAAVDVAGVRTALGRMDQARLRLDGRGSAHRLAAEADMVMVPQPRNKEGAAARADLPLRLNLQAQGGMVGKGWQGQLQKLLWQGTRSSTQTVLEAQPVSLSVMPESGGQRLRLGASRLTVMGMTLNLQSLQGLWVAGESGGVTEADLRLQVPPQNLPALLQRWQPEGGWGGNLAVGGDVQVRHSRAQPWAVDVVLARQSGDVTLSEPTIEGNSQQPLGITEARVALQARNGVWRLTELFEGRVLGRLSGEQVVQAAAPDRLPAGTDTLSGTLSVQIGSLRPWGGWMPAGWRLGGQLQGQATLAGTLGVPKYRGRLTGQRLALAQPLLGVQLSDGEFVLELEGDHARLVSLQARGVQGGVLRADGEALLTEEAQATLRVQAEQFTLLQRVDRRLRVSGALQATFGAQDIGLTGRIGVDEGLFDISRSDAPTIGEDVNVVRRPGQPDVAEAEATAAPATPRKLNAAVDINLGEALRLRGRGIDTLLTGQLRFTTPNNRPSLTGTVRTQQGTYAAYGQKLVIERGAITFTGPIENPRLDVLAMRPRAASAGAIVSVVDVKVGVAITGTAQDPRVSLYSDPAMSETEKLSWLVLGRAPSGLGGADIGLLQSAAVALLSGEKSSPSDNLIGRLGLDQLSVRQTDGAVRDTVVSLGKQVSRFWYVGYERNLNATSGSWQLIYRLGQRMTLRFQAGQDNAVDLIRAWRWD